MDVKWLDDFLAVVECRSFTRAARQRNTSQSGLSRRIQSLEHWVGGSLVDRDAYPFRLTEMGNRFLPLATNLRSALMAVRQLCAADVSEREAPVTLAVAEGLESGMLPILLSRLKEQGITAPVRVVIKNLAAATAAMLEGEADFWLTLQHPQLPLVMDEEAFEAVTVAHDRLSLMVGTAPTGRPLHMLPRPSSSTVRTTIFRRWSPCNWPPPPRDCTCRPRARPIHCIRFARSCGRVWA